MINKKIFITGHTSGLGLGLKTIFEDKNNEVYGLSRSCEQDDRNLKIDLQETSKLKENIQVYFKNKKFDVCFLNAGILGGIQKINNIDEEEIMNVFKINVISTKIIIDSLLANNCCKNFIIMSSGAANKGYDGWLNYCISKASLKQMTSCYAIENKECKFISLAPGVVRTKMQNEILKHDVKKFSSIQKFKDINDTIPSPLEASEKIFKHLEHILNLENGTFFDMRDINDK